MEKNLTQTELVKILQKKGFNEVTARRIQDWRENNLLPKFDCIGRGLGKGKGKQQNQWSNRKMVINQSIWVFKLLENYRSFNDLYLPLWIMGYPIPLEIVRNQLTTSLETFHKDIENDAIDSVLDDELLERNFGFIEDYLGDMFYKISRKDNFTKTFSLPQNLGEALLNLFINPEYFLGDFHFEIEEQLLALKKHQNKLNDKLMNAFELEQTDIKIQNQSNDSNTLEFILRNASFIQKIFSTSQLLKAAQNISDESFMQVQTDMVMLCKMADSVNEGLKIVFKDTPILLDEGQIKGLMQMIFSASKLIILSDISLRTNGYEEIINQVRFQALNKIQETFNSEETQKELEKVNSVFAESYEQMFTKLEKGLKKLLPENKSILHVG